jgi:hypothetical protein
LFISLATENPISLQCGSTLGLLLGKLAMQFFVVRPCCYRNWHCVTLVVTFSNLWLSTFNGTCKAVSILGIMIL